MDEIVFLVAPSETGDTASDGGSGGGGGGGSAGAGGGGGGCGCSEKGGDSEGPWDGASLFDTTRSGLSAVDKIDASKSLYFNIE